MAAGPERVEDIAVVGGGDVGLLTAMALDRGTGAEVRVVDDFDEPVPRVGKSTLYYVVPFLFGSLGIDEERLLANVKLSWKTTVYIEDWCGVGPFHSPLGQTLPVVATEHGMGGDDLHDLTPDNEAGFHEFYYRYQRNNFRTIYGAVAETPGQAPVDFSPDIVSLDKALDFASFQFNSRSLNRFLRRLCRERGIALVDDRITEVDTSGDVIEAIASDEAEYTADLYVDASGFRRQLMGALDNPLEEFDLPVDSAVVATVDIPLDEIVSATVVTTGESGWFWQIDTMAGPTGDRDVGYVYSSDHVSDEAAKREFIETRDEEIDPDEVRWYEFDSGVLETPWMGNCVALGDALGFVEPLQSTALTTACLLANRLATLLPKHGGINHRGLRTVFNETSRATWEEVYDFVSLYYKYNTGETAFWEDARSINPGETRQHELYQQEGLSAVRQIEELDRPGTALNEDYVYFLVLAGLGVESAFYEDLDLEVDPEVADIVDGYDAGLPEQVENFLSYKEIYHSFHPGFE